jgi:uncharacterized radical SAM superfamily protein
MKCNISIVLINPWITDFAAYNLWAEPLGLLYVASILKAAGASIHYVDCLSSSRRPNPSVKPTGCSKYHRRLIEKPEPLTFIKRNYAVYGINESEFLESLGKIPRPDAILVTSHMTYWYPGVFRAIELATGYYGKSVPVILGGIYAKLCTLHAEGFSGASCVFTAQDLYDLLPLVERLTRKTFQRKPSVKDFSRYPLPLHELGAKKNFFCVLTSRGCPFSCSYCASPLLWKNFCKREYSSVVEEIETYTALLGTKNVAFYDDALLVDAEHHILPILKKYSGNPKKIFFHLPNGIHARFVDRKVAVSFKQSGVSTIRLGLETADPELQQATGSKTSNEDYLRAAGHLRSAGYNRKEVGTYIIAGLPGQTPEDVESSIEFVYRAGAAPYLSYFSPIPGTAIWQEASKRSPFPVEREPLFQNNSVFLLGNSGFSSASVQHLRDMAVGLRNSQ